MPRIIRRRLSVAARGSSFKFRTQQLAACSVHAICVAAGDRSCHSEHMALQGHPAHMAHGSQNPVNVDPNLGQNSQDFVANLGLIDLILVDLS